MNNTIAVAGRTLVALILRVLTMLENRGVADVKIRWLLGEGQDISQKIFDSAIRTLEDSWSEYVQRKFTSIVTPGVSFEADRQPSDDIIRVLSRQHPTVSHLLVGLTANFDPSRFPLSFVLGRLLKSVTPTELKDGKFYLTEKEFVRFLLQMESAILADELSQLYPDGFWVMLLIRKTLIAFKIHVRNGVVSFETPERGSVSCDGDIAPNQGVLLPYRG